MSLFFYIILKLFLLTIQQQTIYKENQIMNTYDGLGYALSSSAKIVLQDPNKGLPTYMSINEVSKGTYKLTYDIANMNTDLSLYCQPTIILTKIRRRAGLRSTLQLVLAVKHTLKSGGFSKLCAQVQLIRNVNDPTSAYFIEVYVTNKNFQLIGRETAIIGTTAYLRKDIFSYLVPTINNSTYNGTLDMDSFVAEGLKAGVVGSNDIINSIRIKGVFSTGKDTVNFNYSLLYDYLIVTTSGYIGEVGTFMFDLSIYQSGFSSGQFMESRVAQNVFGMGDIACQFYFLDTTLTMKGSFQAGMGYYQDRWTCPVLHKSIPLDPTRSVKYIVDSSFNFASGSVAACLILQFRNDFNSATQTFIDPTISNTKQVQICPFVNDAPEPQATMLGAFGSYNLYQQVSTDLPPVYIFQIGYIPGMMNNDVLPTEPSALAGIKVGVATGNDITNSINLFDYFKELIRLGKLLSGEMMVSLAWNFKIYGGSGLVYLNDIVLPDEPLPADGTVPISPSPLIAPVAPVTPVGPIAPIGPVAPIAPVQPNSPSQQDPPSQQPNHKSLSPSTNELTCLWPEDNVTQETCQTSYSLRSKLILNIVSMPNLALIMQVGQVFAYIDDFTYFNYQKYYLGEKFNIFVRFMWNLTTERWIPNSIASFYYNIQDSYDDWTSMIEVANIPKKWCFLNEASGFVNNTRDYWIGLVPFTTITFILLHFLYMLFNRFHLKIKSNIISFNWFSILCYSIISQNIQYLAFRSFQQIFRAGSPKAQPFQSLYYLNFAVCYSMLFFVVLYACAGYVILKIFIGENVKHIFDIFKYQRQAIWYLVITNILKIIGGMAHAGLSDYGPFQIQILICGQFIILVMIICFRSAIRLKSSFTMLACEYILRIILYTCLTIRINLQSHNSQMLQMIDVSLDECQIALILMILASAFLQIPISIFGELPKFFNQQEQPGQNCIESKQEGKITTSKMSSTKMSTVYIKQKTLKLRVGKCQVHPKNIIIAHEKNQQAFIGD